MRNRTFEKSGPSALLQVGAGRWHPFEIHLGGHRACSTGHFSCLVLVIFGWRKDRQKPDALPCFMAAFPMPIFANILHQGCFLSLISWCRRPPCSAQGSEREYIIVSFVRSTSQDEDVVTSVAKTAGDSVALQEGSWGSLKGSRLRQLVVKGL